MRPALILLTALLLGCFSDSGGTTCEPGLAGCPCAGGGACESGHECRDPGVCVQENCAPGSRDCVCDGDRCDAGLQCNENTACVSPGGGSGSATSATTTTSGATATAGATGSTTTGPTGGDGTGEPACVSCIVTALQSAACKPAVTQCACAKDSGCVAACAQAGDPIMCLQGCCADAASNPAFFEMLGCGANACPLQCGPVFPVICLAVPT